MDPNANLLEQLELSNELLNKENELTYPEFEERACRLAELVVSLDKWINNGGAIPKTWFMIVCPQLEKQIRDEK